MSLYSCSTTSSSSLTSVTTVSQKSNNQISMITDNEEKNKCAVQDRWLIEKKVSLKNKPASQTGCILKATMKNEQILIYDSSSTRSTLVPGKHVSMKAVFHF